MLKVIRSKLHTLFIPLLFWCSGIIIATIIPYHWSLNLLAGIIFIVMIFIPRVRIYLLFSLLFLLGWMHTTSYLIPNSNKIGAYLTPENPITEIFTYKILETKLTSSGKYYYIIDLERLNDYNISGNVLLYGASDSLKIDNIYQTPLTVYSINKPHNPAEFDFHKYYNYAGIQARASTSGITKYLGKDTNYWHRARSYIKGKIERTFSQDKAMALALFVGDKGLLNVEQDKLSEMGLIHLFAVSGLHVGIIYLTLLTIFNLFLNKNKARLSSSVVLIFYGYLCAWSPSVFRTVLIILIYNLTLYLQRKVSFLQLISITLFIITISNPLQLFSVGLQLSFTAFIALWVADRNLLPYLSKLKRKFYFNKYIFQAGQYIIYSLTVIIFITPLSVYYFNIISFNAFITNCIATPIVALMLNIILFSLFIPQTLFLHKYLAEAFSFLNLIFNKIIDFASYLPFFTRRIALTKVELLLILGLIIISIFLFKKQRIKYYIFIGGASLLLILKLSGFFTIYQNQVICFDAGNADCNYIEFSDGHNLIIDTGSMEQIPTIMKSSLVPYLKKRHINSVDKVIVTHSHEDHYGGLLFLTQNIDIQEIIIHQISLTDKKFSEIIEKLEANHNITVLQDTTSIWNRKVRFLHPDNNYESTNMNNNSLVTMVSYEDYKLLFTGDIEEEAEQRLVKQYDSELKADFLKVAHHGSISSSTEDFLNMVSSHKCFIPAGNRDRDKFPNPIVLQRLEDRNVERFIGADNGALIMKIKQED